MLVGLSEIFMKLVDSSAHISLDVLVGSVRLDHVWENFITL